MKLSITLVIMLLLAPTLVVQAASPTQWADAAINHIMRAHDPDIPPPNSLTPDYKTHPVDYFRGDGWVVKQNTKNAVGPLIEVYYGDTLYWRGLVSWTKLKVTEYDYSYTDPSPEPVPEPDPVNVNEYIVLKANFHTHTTVSDGQYTPSQVVQIYKNYGYDVLAVTDHGATRQYEQAISTANQLGVILVKGSEIIVHKNEAEVASEVLGLFIQSDIAMSRYGDVERVVNDIHAQGGLAVVCHPTKTLSFWGNYVTTPYLDGWEYPTYLNVEATMINHDFHNVNHIKLLPINYNLVFAHNRTLAGVYEAIQNKRIVIYVNGQYLGPQELISLIP